LHICAPINQRTFGFAEIAFLEFEIYKIVPRLQPLPIHRAPVFGVKVIACTFFALWRKKLGEEKRALGCVGRCALPAGIRNRA
jgi:hypothetical protein